ncbi:ribonuclease E activity regulator RraA [Formosa sp. L2A11]|uniref:ribonuclease E activity regulator RraA n=1 Tax=Formosa sp. L2A11 TaxID=2686363 RepID=UPI0018EEF96D|nr:ribonuclease E activity regulator RraA [Formosa sp. L2A11]
MFTTADLCDAYQDVISCVNPVFRSYGAKKSFYGKITTLKIFEDNSLVRKQLELDGTGKVLVIDGGASLRCALIGDQLALLAIQNHWNGILVNGCIRDSQLIHTMNIGIRALNTSPFKSIKQDQGEICISVKFGGVTFNPNQYIYVDLDGIIVSELNLIK